MIIMNLKVNNLLAFKDFEVDFSYPKKIVDSYIENEHLRNHPNFRYKKVNIVMGANASGKTSLGRMIMNAVTFIDTKRFECLTDCVNDTSSDAFLSLDFVGNGEILYNMTVEIAPMQGMKYTSDNLKVTVLKASIGIRDSYENCRGKFKEVLPKTGGNYAQILDEIETLSFCFQYPVDADGEYRLHTVKKPVVYSNIMEKMLRALDPAIDKVEPLTEVDNSFVIRMGKRSFILKDGELTNRAYLSSGTKSGIAVADILYSIKEEGQGLYYCDEKFSYINSDIEKAAVSVMIECLKDNDQLFFTTHNTDMLDLPLPKHSFLFMRKDALEPGHSISCVSASAFLKRNTDSVRKAVENDLMSVAPSTDLIFEIGEM
ncbi:AAA family ATPase [Lachnospiraceae bacterium C1.1]|nr:ATP-binding protein [Lachnospiraceae bacterium C1.1]